MRPKGCFEEWVVERLADDTVAWLGLDGAQNLPPRCERLELVTNRARVLNEKDRASALSYAQGQTIDTFDDGKQVVLRPATEKALLHVDYQKHVHGHTSSFVWRHNGPALSGRRWTPRSPHQHTRRAARLLDRNNLTIFAVSPA
jgi:hypothetical protein